MLRRPVDLTVAGRTDRGVHAWAQVASYEGEPVDPGSLNALTGDDVAARACEAAPAGFDARRDATSRAYCYRVLARRQPGAFEHGRALHWPHRIDRDALRACAAALSGTHDFTAFTPTQTDHVRFERDVFAARWVEEGDVLAFWIEADTFMRHMNRVLVGTMLEVAGGRRSLASFERLLEGQPRSEAGPTAPAHGLYLAGVGYGGTRVLAPDAGELPRLEGERVVLRPARAEDAPSLAAILAEPEVARWWGSNDIESVREQIRDQTSFTILVDGAPSGWLQVNEENDPEYRSVGLDIALATALHGRGYGREALRLAIRHLIGRGHHRFTIDPAAGNERAIRCYAAVGFKPVGAMRSYERAPDGVWRDALLMDLLADELEG